VALGMLTLVLVMLHFYNHLDPNDLDLLAPS
jgi:hypothetical protein